MESLDTATKYGWVMCQVLHFRNGNPALFQEGSSASRGQDFHAFLMQQRCYLNDSVLVIDGYKGFLDLFHDSRLFG